MKKVISTLAVLTIAAHVNAATQTTATDVKETKAADNAIHKGIKASLISGNSDFKIKVKASYAGGSISDSTTEKTDSTTIGIAYQALYVQKIGFTAGIAQTNHSANGTTLRNTMLEGNATYGINDNVYVLGGLNASRYYADSTEDNDVTNELGTGYGLQAAAGYQITKNISAELKYASTKHSYEETKEGVDLKLDLDSTSLRLGINATF